MGQTSRPGRVLGLDLGDARIGVAISDDDRRMAVPLGTIHTGAPGGPEGRGQAGGRTRGDLGRRRPPALDERRTRDRPRRRPSAFADALRSFLAVPVELQDERLSTVEAERGLRDAGVTGRERRKVVDRTAATVILQAWLDATR